MAHKELRTILYAEDEEDIRAIAQIALEDIGGFTVQYCTNGAEVREKAEAFPPDLFLFDVMMPKMDGPTALSELRKIPQFANVPAIFMTAKIQDKERDEYKAMGAIEVIAKPFDPMHLADLIKNAWKKHHG
ncbi:MAG: response regulator [Tatlockia sp.]|jgi:CheY-like chemotaxis protein